MKRLILSLALLGSVLFLCYFGVSFVNSTYEEITSGGELKIILGE